MAVVWMAARHDNTVGAIGKGFKKQHEINAACAGKPDYPYVRSIFYTAGAGKVGSRVCAPVAYECYNFWFKF